MKDPREDEDAYIRTEINRLKERGKRGGGGLGFDKQNATGFAFAVEFFVAILVSFGLGFSVDVLFGTKPFGLLILGVLGIVAATWNLIRRAAKN